MTGKERVKRAIEFRGPDCVPLFLEPYPKVEIPGLEELNSDVVVARPDPHPGWKPARPGEDEWGCVWGEAETALGIPIGFPLEDWANLGSYRFPPAFRAERLATAENKARQFPDKYLLLATRHTLFERLQYLRKFDNLMVDLYTEKEKVNLLMDRIMEYNLGFVEQCQGRGIDGFSIMDDWGTQRALFINPNMWREMFKPRYKILFDAIHAAGMHVFLHSCGLIWEILDDFCQLGLDVYQVTTPAIMGVPRLGSALKDKVCVMAGVDQAAGYAKGNAMELRRQARQVVESFASPRGGLIATVQAAHTRNLKLGPELQAAVIETFKELQYAQAVS